MVAKASPNDSFASVYVGSADGVVTRFEKRNVTIGNETVRPLVPVARSHQVGGAPFALGCGAWAMDVGDLDTNQRAVVVPATGASPSSMP